jgi:hypothetical protein
MALIGAHWFGETDSFSSPSVFFVQYECGKGTGHVRKGITSLEDSCRARIRDTVFGNLVGIGISVEFLI